MSAEVVSKQLKALEWFTMPDGRPAFRGMLGGYRRLIVGATKEQLINTAEQMARGEL